VAAVGLCGGRAVAKVVVARYRNALRSKKGGKMPVALHVFTHPVAKL
jgi:hypothetical protein